MEMEEKAQRSSQSVREKFTGVTEAVLSSGLVRCGQIRVAVDQLHR